MLSGMPCVTTWNRAVCQDPQLDQIPFLFRNESSQKDGVIEIEQPALIHRRAGFHIDRPPYPGVEGQIKKERARFQALFVPNMRKLDTEIRTVVTRQTVGARNAKWPGSICGAGPF